MYEIHVSMELMPETIKTQKNKMGIIGNDMRMKKNNG